MEDITLIALAPFYAMAVAATAYVTLRLISSAYEVRVTENPVTAAK